MAESNKQAQALINWLEDLFKKAPHLPANVQKILVDLAPWMALLFGILGLIGGVFALGGNANVLVMITRVLTIVSSVLLLMAYPKLVKRSYAGWRLLFYSDVLSVVASLLSFSLGTLIWIIIVFYILFEMKGHYKN